ncbi:MAG: helix-turn-helix domain-containing protein [Lentisphaeria bacterium]|nr:helix-turn-helix domain-containing protein [Lentisphaeria bacterium]
MKIRLQHAGDLLINSNSSIAEIAEQCGFYDSNYFCKQFRRAFAVSPRSFRQQYRSG